MFFLGFKILASPIFFGVSMDSNGNIYHVRAKCFGSVYYVRHILAELKSLEVSNSHQFNFPLTEMLLPFSFCSTILPPEGDKLVQDGHG